MPLDAAPVGEDEFERRIFAGLHSSIGQHPCRAHEPLDLGLRGAQRRELLERAAAARGTHRERVLNAELRLQQTGDLDAVELEFVLLVSMHHHAGNFFARDTEFGHQLQDCVLARVQSAAARIRLHAGARDAELPAEAGQRCLGCRDAFGIGRVKPAPLGFEHLARAGHARLRKQRGGQAILGCFARMKTLGHCPVGKESPDAAGKSARDAERVGETFGVEPHEFRACRRSAEAAADARGVPAQVLDRAVAARPFKRARRKVVACHQRGDRLLAAERKPACQRADRRNDDGARVSAAAEVVELQRVRRGTVHHGGHSRGKFFRATPQRCRAGRRFHRNLGGAKRGVHDLGARARNARRKGVDEKALGQTHRVRRQSLKGCGRPVVRERFGKGSCRRFSRGHFFSHARFHHWYAAACHMPPRFSLAAPICACWWTVSVGRSRARISCAWK